MTRIAVIGTGHVGLVCGTCFAELGNTVVCLDTDERKIARLLDDITPFYEPRLREMIVRNQRAERLSFSTDIAAGVRRSDMIFIAVGTPMRDDGHADLSALRSAAETIGRALNGPKIVVSKSTVPVQTGDLIAATIAEHAAEDHPVDVVSNPEFLREGSAVADFMTPDRIVIGTSSATAEAVMRALYRPLNAPFVVTDVRTSETIKYAANAFLATKISFMNEIANICDLTGVDVEAVARGIGLDHRIGTDYMKSGIGYGGSCLPKDVRALSRLAAERSYDAVLLDAVETVNRRQAEVTVRKILGALEGAPGARTVGVLGLSFKPNTDDIRESPSIRIISDLLDAGCAVFAHDPVALTATRERFGDRVGYCDRPYDACRDADVLFVATEWNEYKNIDFRLVRTLMRGRTVVDGRNIYDPESVTATGLHYTGIGRRV